MMLCPQRSSGLLCGGLDGVSTIGVPPIGHPGLKNITALECGTKEKAHQSVLQRSAVPLSVQNWGFFSMVHLRFTMKMIYRSVLAEYL